MRISDIRRDVFESITKDDRHIHPVEYGEWSRRQALRVLARMTDRNLRRYYRQVSRDVEMADGSFMPLGPKHNAKVFNLAEKFGE